MNKISADQIFYNMPFHKILKITCMVGMCHALLKDYTYRTETCFQTEAIFISSNDAFCWSVTDPCQRTELTSRRSTSRTYMMPTFSALPYIHFFGMQCELHIQELSILNRLHKNREIIV